MEIGRWNLLPHYAVVGSPVCFYIWVNEDGCGSSSKWIIGREAFSTYSKLSSLHKKDNKKFIDELKIIAGGHKNEI